jgi:hypothetical protein
VVDEAGRLQHRLQQQHDRAVEVERQRPARGLVEGVQRRRFGGRQRAPVRLRPERRDEHAGAARLGGGVRRRAGQDRRQLGRHVLRQRLGRGLQGGGVQGSDRGRLAEREGVVAEIVCLAGDVVELKRRVGEQIANRVEVFARGQTPRRHRARRVRIRRARDRAADARRSDRPGQARPAQLLLPPIAPLQPAPSRAAQKLATSSGKRRVIRKVREVMMMFAPSRNGVLQENRAPPPKATNTYIGSRTPLRDLNRSLPLHLMPVQGLVPPNTFIHRTRAGPGRAATRRRGHNDAGHEPSPMFGVHRRQP